MLNTILVLTPLKPKRYSEINPSNWAIATDVLGALTDRQIFYCGNIKCKAMIIADKKKGIPKFCSKCGNEVDWADIFTKIIKICPKCKKQYPETENYCVLDGSKLGSKAVPK